MALRDVSAQADPGNVTVILGPNGAGKSSLLGALAGLQKLAGGSVLLDEQMIAAMPARERARRIGLLAQKADIHWDIDVRALVALGRLPYHGRWGRTPADEAAIDDAMAQTDCVNLATRSARQLSGGEQGRVLLARALAGQPDWLLADEPLTNLDPVHQIDALRCLRAVADRGVGVVMVLHDLTQAARIADQIIILNAGQVVATGSASTVLTTDLLASVFGIRVHVGNDLDGRPIITPIDRAG
jgi:iron complex transport system ATP-binding protein